MRIKRNSECRKISPERALDVGRKIDRWRKEKALTQTSMQQIAGISQGQLSRILEGKFSVATMAVQSLCAAAGVSLEETAKERAIGVGKDLERELHRSWDGTEEHARELIRLLQVARALRKLPLPKIVRKRSV